MKKLSLLLLSCFFLLSCNIQEKEERSSLSPILYKISGNSLTKPSYLFGTMHIIPADKFIIPSIVNQKLSEAEMLVLEVDIDIPLKEQVLLAQRMIIPDNKTLKDILPEQEFRQLESIFIDSLGLNEKKTERYMHIKPFFLVGVLLQEYYGKVENFETHFHKMAKKQNKEFAALETIDFQMSLIDTISIVTQSESYLIGDIFTEYNKMMEIYFSGNLQELYQFMIESDGYDEIEEPLMIARNMNWLPKITDLLPEKSLFITVGAGHLPGERGIISILEKQGFLVERVNEEEPAIPER